MIEDRIVDPTHQADFALKLLRASAHVHREMAGFRPLLPLAPKVESTIERIAGEWGLPPIRTVIQSLLDLADPNIAGSRIKEIISHTLEMHNRIC